MSRQCHGEVKVFEPYADLAILMACFYSFKNQAISERLAVFGEIGLTDEVKPVQRGIAHFNKASELGFDTVIMPNANLIGIKQGKAKAVAIKTLEQAIDAIFSE